MKHKRIEALEKEKAVSKRLNQKLIHPYCTTFGAVGQYEGRGELVKCPLLKSKQVNYAGSGLGRGEREAFLDCIKENCAWWDIVHKQCSIRTAIRCLTEIHFDLKLIESAISPRRFANESSPKK